MDIFNNSWHWSFSGFMIVMVMFLLLYLGRRFGVSSSFRTTCSALGAGRFVDYFDINWKSQFWLFAFVLGGIIGGVIAAHFMPNILPTQLAAGTIEHLQALGVSAPEAGQMIPDMYADLSSGRSVLLMVIGGLLIGFGTRYAGGCTSGHAISGLSNLQLPSLVAVIGFFIGGLIMTYLILPNLLN